MLINICYNARALSVKAICDTADFIAIDKPTGVSVHKDDADEGLLSLLARELGLPKLYLVHRLDKVTSGILLLAKHAEAASALSKAFRERSLTKCYIALSDKKPKKKQGLIKGDMLKSRRGTWRLAKTMDAPAESRFYSYAYKPGLRVFLVKPITGKTHQIRVALKSISAPIVGDSYYHETVVPAPDRTYLHAYWLAFTLGGKDYELTAVPDQGELFDDEFRQWIATNLPTPTHLWG